MCHYCDVELEEEYKMCDCHLCEDWGGCKRTGLLCSEMS